MGVLMWPFKALTVLLLVASLVGAWLYRDQLRDVGRLVFRSSPTSSSVGRPGERALAAALAQVSVLAQGQADSVVLSASEMASLIGDGLDPAFRGHLDSLEVELLEGAIAVRAKLQTSAMPREALGPLVFIVQEWEPFAASGPVRVVESGMAEWDLEQLAIRDIPFPSEMVDWLVINTLGGTPTGGFPVRIPEGISDATIRPTGVVLYGRTP